MKQLVSFLFGALYASAIWVLCDVSQDSIIYSLGLIVAITGGIVLIMVALIYIAEHWNK
jgi:hypothetical protein